VVGTWTIAVLAFFISFCVLMGTLIGETRQMTWTFPAELIVSNGVSQPDLHAGLSIELSSNVQGDD